MISASKVMMLMRREVWENRSLWIAPLAISGVILVSALIGDGPLDGGGPFRIDGKDPFAQVDPGAEKRELMFAGVLGMLTVVQLFALGIVVFFYLLDSLLAERKDRSILFWKSLPISDTEVVTSKALTALVAAPLFVLLLSAVTQLVFTLVLWARLSGSGLAKFIALDPGLWLQLQVGFLAFIPAMVLWYLPIAAYLMLVSIWARKNAFLWAILPPVALLLVEGLMMQTHYVADFLGRRLAGAFMIMDSPEGDVAPSLGLLMSHVARVFTHHETWLGVLVAIGFFVACIRIRRYRDDS
jgi:ABC-2 type transport system permease protein